MSYRAERRRERVNVTLRRELDELVRKEIADPRLAPMTSITRVECASDLSSAAVYVSVMGSDRAREESLLALRSAAGLLRRMMGERVLMRRVPRLVFVGDRTLADAAAMLALMDRVAREDERSAEGSDER